MLALLLLDAAARARAAHLDFGAKQAAWRSKRRGDGDRRCSCQWVLLVFHELLRLLLCCWNAVLRSAGASAAHLARVWGIVSECWGRRA